MPKRHVDLTGLPRHLHNRLKWDRGTPMLFLQGWPGPAFKEIEHWALMNNIKIIFPHSAAAD